MDNSNYWEGKVINIGFSMWYTWNIFIAFNANVKCLCLLYQKKIVGVSYEKHHDIVWFKWLNPIRSLISDKKITHKENFWCKKIHFFSIKENIWERLSNGGKWPLYIWNIILVFQIICAHHGTYRLIFISPKSGVIGTKATPKT